MMRESNIDNYFDFHLEADEEMKGSFVTVDGEA